MELIKKKAIKSHICTNCNKEIENGEHYFSEDRFLASLNKNQIKLCVNCFKKLSNNA
jgi:hypothetical protein